jgi:signal transduction histidine kinase/DNA-binding response OmpR family regulator
MSIRRRLFLSFLVILALFTINIVIYRQGNTQRAASFDEVKRAVDRQVLVGEIGKELEERRKALPAMKVFADTGTTFKPGQIEDLFAELEALDARVAKLQALSDHADPTLGTSDPLVNDFVQRWQMLKSQWTTFYGTLRVAGADDEPADTGTGTAGGGEAPAEEAASPETTAGDGDAAAAAKPVDLARVLVEKLATLEERERRHVGEATQTFNEVATTTDRIGLWIFALSALVALGVALWVSAHLNRGLQALESGARRIGRGDLDHRIAIKGRDELAELATAFNRMSERLKAARERVEVARAAAEDANRAKSSFLANMSHELRTPMNAIIGYTEMLTEDAEDLGQDDFIPDLKKILAAGKHLLALINDVLDLSKIEAGKMTLYLEEFEVAALIDDVATTIQPLVDKNANRLIVDLDPRAGMLKADETKVRQTLFNLLSNASKFTNQGTITLEARRHEREGRDWLTFKVSDTGIGMSEQQMAKVFDEFTQADSSTTRKFGGTGLGLTISKKFCQMMGGDITVASEEGHGTRFTVELPAVVGDEPAAPPQPQPEAARAGSGGGADGAETVLVIDDDPTVLDLTRRYLTREGYAVQTAGSGVEGLELAKTLKPAAITLDVMMPGMDGWAVLTSLKKDPDTADIPVIMLTMLDEKEMGFALGASEYMSKPIDRRRLSAFLDKYLASSRAGAGRILVVDDEAEARDLMRRGLERNGWTIDEAEDGKQALERLGEMLPDLVLLDLRMPEMDGFEFLERLRAAPEWHDIPVVVVTGRDLTADEQAKLEGNVEAVLKKGAHPRDNLLGELRDLVAECVARG